VNYYFGGIEGLFAAVLQEATSRLVNSDALRSAVAGQTTPKAKLEAFLGLFVQEITSPVSSSWVVRVIGREMLAQSPSLVALKGKERHKRVRISKAIVGELMGLPEDHTAVARGCVNVIGPCFLLLICDRSAFKEMFPNFGFIPKDGTALLQHLVEFA